MKTTIITMYDMEIEIPISSKWTPRIGKQIIKKANDDFVRDLTPEDFEN